MRRCSGRPDRERRGSMRPMAVHRRPDVDPGYNRRTQRARSSPRSPVRMHPCPPTPAATERAHKAAKRYIYAWGGGQAEGNAHDARPARRQGRRAWPR